MKLPSRLQRRERRPPNCPVRRDNAIILQPVPKADEHRDSAAMRRALNRGTTACRFIKFPWWRGWATEDSPQW